MVNEFDYLGTVFKYTGSFILNQQTRFGKGLKALNSLFYNTGSIHLLQKLCASCSILYVGSILNYSCEVLGLGKSKV